MNTLRLLDEAPSQSYAVQCFAQRACVLYIDQYGDGSLAALHGIPGDPHPTHAQRWASAVTGATHHRALLGQFLRYIHPELVPDPRELPGFAIAAVTSTPPSAGRDPRRN